MSLDGVAGRRCHVRLIVIAATLAAVFGIIAINLALAFGVSPWKDGVVATDELNDAPAAERLSIDNSDPALTPINSSSGFPALPPNVKLLYITGFNTRQRILAQLAHLPPHTTNQVAIFSDVTDDFRYTAEGDRESRVIHAIDTMEVVERAGSFLLGEDHEHRKLIKDAFLGDQVALRNPALKDRDRNWKLARFKFPVVLFHAAELALDPSSPFDAFWFMDDDSHVMTTSLQPLLDLFGPPDSTVLYLGTETWAGSGNYMAHGGSSFLLSRAALRRIDFGKRHRCLSAAMSQCCGDAAVSQCLSQVGVKLSPPPPRGQDLHWWFENAGILGGPVRHALSDRCAPVIALHIRGPPGWIDPWLVAGLERRVWRDRGWRRGGTVTWSEVVEAVLLPHLRDRGGSRIGLGDVRGSRGPDALHAVLFQGALDAVACEEACGRNASCLAWEWRPAGPGGGRGVCRNAPWFILGKDEDVERESAEGVVSGAMAERYLHDAACEPPVLA